MSVALNEREREIDNRIRKAQRQEFFRVLWESRLAAFVGVSLLGAIAFGAGFAMAPTRLEGEQLGHVVTEGSVATTRKDAPRVLGPGEIQRDGRARLQAANVDQRGYRAPKRNWPETPGGEARRFLE